MTFFARFFQWAPTVTRAQRLGDLDVLIANWLEVNKSAH